MSSTVPAQAAVIDFLSEVYSSMAKYFSKVLTKPSLSVTEEALMKKFMVALSTTAKAEFIARLNKDINDGKEAVRTGKVTHNAAKTASGNFKNTPKVTVKQEKAGPGTVKSKVNKRTLSGEDDLGPGEGSPVRKKQALNKKGTAKIVPRNATKKPATVQQRTPLVVLSSDDNEVEDAVEEDVQYEVSDDVEEDEPLLEGELEQDLDGNGEEDQYVVGEAEPAGEEEEEEPAAEDGEDAVEEELPVPQPLVRTRAPPQSLAQARARSLAQARASPAAPAPAAPAPAPRRTTARKSVS